MSAVHPASQKLSEDFAAKLSGMSNELCQMHPRGESGAWSVQDVVEHLVLTYRGTVVQTEKYRQRGSPSEKRADFRQTVARVVVVSLGHFPGGNAAPEFVLPGRSGLEPMSGEALALLFHDELSRMDEQLDGCQQVFGSRPFAGHFRLGPLSAQQWRKFHLVHGRHHLAQVDRIEAQISTPAGASPRH